MELSAENKLILIGTPEAVAEVCMQARYGVWRRHSTRYSSSGIQAIESDEGRSLVRAVYSLLDLKGPPISLCLDLSKVFPEVVVGLSAAVLGNDNLPDDACNWAASLFLAGKEHTSDSLGLLFDHLPTELHDTIATGNFKSAALPRLHAYAEQRFAQDARARLSAAAALGAVRSGYPRWDMAAHLACAQGLGGLAAYLQSSATKGDPAKVLIACVDQARQQKVASWLDGLLYGSRTPANDDDDKNCAAYSDADDVAFESRLAGMLSFLGEASPDDPLACAVTAAFASPRAILQDGSHVLPRLMASKAKSVNALAGAQRLAVAAQANSADFDYGHRTDAVFAAQVADYAPHALRMAAAMGMSEGEILARCLPLKSAPESEHVQLANRLMEAFLAIHESTSNFSPSLTHAFENESAATAYVLESRRTEESMRATITNWTAVPATQASSVTVTTKRARRVVL